MELVWGFKLRISIINRVGHFNILYGLFQKPKQPTYGAIQLLTINTMNWNPSYNNYNIYKNQLSSKVISIVIDDNTSRLVSVGISVFGDDYLDVLDEIYEKNLDYIVEQLEAL